MNTTTTTTTTTATKAERNSYEAVLRMLESRQEVTQPVRQWGFEVEHPAIARTRSDCVWADRRVFSFVTDSSVDKDSDYCECGCSDCNEHDCDCDYCDNRGGYQDHDCGSEECSSNEVATREPLQVSWGESCNTFLKLLTEHAERWDAEGENWGGHIHIEGRDLTRAQARQVVRVGEHILANAPEWFTGWDDTYNYRTELVELDNFIQGYGTNRGRWVSINNLGREPRDYKIGDQTLGKTTVEIRRFRTSTDADLIRIRGAFGRALVEFCKTNQAIYWAMRETDFQSLLELIEFGKH